MASIHCYPRHVTADVVIKRASVDVLMVPVVEWLNAFSSVTTQFCCQGHYSQKPKHDNRFTGANVVFYCTDPGELFIICRELYCLGQIDVEAWQGSLRYNMTFGTKKMRDDFIKRIKKEQRKKA